MPEKKFEKSFSTSPEVLELKKKIEQLEGRLKKEKVPEFERTKEVKKEIKDHVEKLQEPSSEIPTKERDEAGEISEFTKPQQVSSLISLAFEKGIKEAVDVAKSLHNPAVLDEFHDTLVDKYYEKLKEEGII